ncbi:unnamed protein product [Schistosoma turkestanicum]|nr:unnamed protein product [Schistosoma turkestanicum]
MPIDIPLSLKESIKISSTTYNISPNFNIANILSTHYEQNESNQQQNNEDKQMFNINKNDHIVQMNTSDTTFLNNGESSDYYPIDVQGFNV